MHELRDADPDRQEDAGITPSSATPRKHAIETQNSEGRTRNSRRTFGISTRLVAATITIAPSVACGRFRSAAGANSSISAITAAPTTPVSWVLAPADSATGVRDELLEIGKPWNRPVARFAAPSAIISRFGSTSSPSLAAYVRESTLVSANATSAIDTAAAASRGGRRRARSADRARATPGQGTDDLDVPVRPKIVTASEPHDRDEHPRHDRRQALAGDDDHDRGDADRERRDDGLPVRDPSHEGGRLVQQPLGVGREAEDLRELAHDHGERDPVQVAESDREREQVGQVAEPEQSGQHEEGAGHQRRHAGEGEGLLGVAGRERHDRDRDDRRERRVGAEHQDPRRPEDRVDEQGHDRRVQAGDRREAGGLRVPHAHRDEEGGQHEAGDQVIPQPRPLVRTQDRQARHEAGPSG